MRILIADDHPLFREALQDVIREACGDVVFVEVSSYDELLAAVRTPGRFDLVFVDLMMPGMEEFDGIAELCDRAGAVPVVVISSRADAPSIRRVTACGVRGYITKSQRRSEMLAAIRTVLAGGKSLPSRERNGAVRAESGVLTAREAAVLSELARGSSNRQIASDLCIEESTVKAHISSILRKLHVRNRLEAVVTWRSMR
jgi:DNA-binding NarL/FixJ family response regulator